MDVIKIEVMTEGTTEVTIEMTTEVMIEMMIAVTIEMTTGVIIDGTIDIRGIIGNPISSSMAMMRVMEDGTVAARADIAPLIDAIVTIPVMDRFMAPARGHALADISETAFMDLEASVGITIKT